MIFKTWIIQIIFQSNKCNQLGDKLKISERLSALEIGVFSPRGK